MRWVVSREQAREFDRYASEHAKVPSLLLMENAGRGATERLLALRAGEPGRVVILAGPGNNGGDGFVVGRRLRVLGHSVELWLLGDESRLIGDAAIMCRSYRELGGELRCIAGESSLAALAERLSAADTIVDALFGTGLARPLEGIAARVVELVRQSSGFVLSLDIPSGLDANRGRILGAAVRANATVTFASEKLGHFTSDGAECCGQLELVDIGVPADLCQRTGYSATRLTARELAAHFRRRSVASHKGRAGRVAVIAGHAGTSGAALLAARGALRGGAGLVTHIGLPDTIHAIETRVLEAMTKTLDPAALEASLTAVLAPMDSVVLGPGLGLGELERRMVLHVCEKATQPVVVDADALSILAEALPSLLRAKGPRILLPHRGELARLLSLSNAQVEEDPFAALTQAVAATRAIVVLKGAYTLLGAPNQTISIGGRPCPVLGTAGSGDVLSGVVAALAVDHEPWTAALLGVALHARAGMLWANRRGADRGMVASDIAEQLPDAIAELSRGAPQLTD